MQNQVKVSTGMVLTKLIVIAVLGAVMIPYWNLANVGAFPNMNDFGAVNAVYASFFKKMLPARSCVEIGKLPMNGDVEVEVVAYCK
ncbi:Rid family hydrolase [Megasphaera elsdenii]|uniref:Rid family hydrolase n=1 Tax=Megasphaera elsdenii TaxID=907 RepID=UPI004036599F